MSDGSTIWQAMILLGAGSPMPFAEFMEQGALGVSIFETPDGGWSVAALHRTRPDAGALGAGLALVAASEGVDEPALQVAPVPAADWLAVAYAGFPSRRIGRFHIYGSHIADRPPAGAIPLKIDAATAFGSGEHATTEGCLAALGLIRRRRTGIRRALDMGTGSGILAIAIAKSWKMAEVAAIDIDPESARVAGANARLNGVADRVRARQGDGYRAPLARTGPPFDLIVANILARPLIRMAPRLKDRLAPGGVAVLSGLLRRQENAVLAAHRAAGLRFVGRRPVGEWRSLILRRP